VLQIQLLRWRFDIKNANTEDARNKQKQEFLPSATHPMLAQISSKTASKNSCILRLPRVLAFLEARPTDV
jgi:hypothetical protein